MGSSVGRWAVTTLGSLTVFVVCVIFIAQSSVPLVANAATSVVGARKPPIKQLSYLAPLAEIPAGTISAVGPMPSPPGDDVASAPHSYQETAQPVASRDVRRLIVQPPKARGQLSSTSARLASVRRGDGATVLQKSGNWLRVRYAGGAEGWVHVRRDQ